MSGGCVGAEVAHVVNLISTWRPTLPSVEQATEFFSLRPNGSCVKAPGMVIGARRDRHRRRVQLWVLLRKSCLDSRPPERLLDANPLFIYRDRVTVKAAKVL
jgi:hypothetical protein